MKRHNEKETPTTFGDFVLFLPMLSDEAKEKDLAILNKAIKPKFLCKRIVPDSFDLITFGQYSDLCDALEEKNHIVAMRKIIKTIFPDVADKNIDDETAYDVWGFCNFAIKQTEHISKVFSSISITHSSEEIAAGIDRLQFGTFGILDWYAKRMGITDQQQVYDFPWVRIYQCMANDTEEAEFSRRLQRIYEQKNKHK